MIYEISHVNDKFVDLIQGDPVRPHIPVDSRINVNSRVLVLLNQQEVQSVVCVSFVDHVPSAEEDLFDTQCELPSVAVLYTIWSLKPGGGQAMVFEARDWIKANRASVKRIVTLSPQTEMARRFHIKNGAWELRVNPTTINFEYALN